MAQNKKYQKKPEVVDNTYGRLQPQALEVERAILGALMIDKYSFSLVCDILQPDSFYEPRNQKIYEIIRNLNMEDEAVDMLTVTEALAKAGTLEEVGGPDYIAELSSRVASSANIKYHANIVADKALGRQIISVLSDPIEKAYDDTEDNEDVLQVAEQRIFELNQRKRGRGYSQIDKFLDESEKCFLEAMKTNGVIGVTTGYDRIDEITGGWQKPNLIIIAGRPAMGKTAFAISIARKMAVDNNVPVGIFTLEMSPVQLSNRLLCNVCKVDGTRYQTGQLQPDELFRFDKKKNILRGKPIYIDEDYTLTVYDIKSRTRRLVKEHGVKAIIIDYLQLVHGNNLRYNNRQEEVSSISRALKELAIELDIPIIALSQMNRSVEGREGDLKRPQLSDLRESGAIEQDADMVIFVHRPEYYRIFQDDKGNDLHGKAMIIIEKNRFGANAELLFDFKGEYFSFEDPEEPQPFLGEGDVFAEGLNI